MEIARCRFTSVKIILSATAWFTMAQPLFYPLFRLSAPGGSLQSRSVYCLGPALGIFGVAWPSLPPGCVLLLLTCRSACSTTGSKGDGRRRIWLSFCRAERSCQKFLLPGFLCFDPWDRKIYAQRFVLPVFKGPSDRSEEHSFVL